LINLSFCTHRPLQDITVRCKQANNQQTHKESVSDRPWIFRISKQQSIFSGSVY
jgi:hypothetical protein